MTLLILGLALWWIGHLFPLVTPGARAALAARLGENAYKGLFSLAALAAIALMVVGYRQADFIPLWEPPAWARHLNNLLMLFAVGLFGASHSTGNVKRFVRHPMLSAVAVWAAAHLLVNGDAASAALFGGMGLWALAAMRAANARDGAWTRPAPAPLRKDLILVAITLVAYAAIAAIHGWLGRPVFPG
ncbi:NnrU family protein [Oceanicella actignis]|uniref:NnrU protein n=1 Tax=Oceanicella actignis TaxID=1189325 RepID=A0A1M7TAJ8_9RHOB|nr:NnrU family protein [Oceanicella actignis]SET52472.1 NnrU protein [Oceanicella actignis]SHN67742.1 NnrU protein [Oceanicella actignis]